MTPAEVGAAATGGTTVAKESWNCFKPHFDYVKDLKKNYEELRSEYGYHSAAEKDINERLSRRAIAMKMTTPSDLVLSNVRSTGAKFHDLEAKYQKVSNTGCLYRMWHFCKLRKLGKQIVETKGIVVREKEEMKELVREGKFINF